MLQRDQFELLSAYLDGEVTAAERRQVEELLSHDEKSQQLYARLLHLRDGFQGLPLTASQPVDDTVAQVMSRLEQHRPARRAWILGGGAIAAAAVAAMTGLFGPSPVGQFAQRPVPGSPTTIDPVFRPDESGIAASPQAIAVFIPEETSSPASPASAHQTELSVSINEPVLPGMD
ncbi:MAG: transcriptional regulator [Synechococcales cyanobacterium CRU_2_2]|nr:transcriptional regulator [Synechococcales cyanobacterium CRU_2_2]